MRLLTIAAATLALGTITLTASANAEETGNLSTCVKLASEVSKALASNPQSPSHDAATREKTYGRDYCATGLYAQGTTHYAEALKLLGGEKPSSS